MVRPEALNRGLPVKGYQPQSDEKVRVVNTNKEIEEVVLRTLDMLAKNPLVDQRWLALGRTHIEQGFMAVNRSIFRPERIALIDDGPPKPAEPVSALMEEAK